MNATNRGWFKPKMVAWSIIKWNDERKLHQSNEKTTATTATNATAMMAAEAKPVLIWNINEIVGIHLTV